MNYDRKMTVTRTTMGYSDSNMGSIKCVIEPKDLIIINSIDRSNIAYIFVEKIGDWAYVQLSNIIVRGR